MTTKQAALAITLLLGAAAPAWAQSYQRPTPQPQIQAPPAPAPAGQPAATPAQPARNYNLTRQERQAFQPVLAAVTAGDWAAATTALATVAPQATSNDGKYL